MSDINKDTQTSIIVPTTDDSDKLSSAGQGNVMSVGSNVIDLVRRFDLMIQMVSEPIEVLERPGITLLTHGMKGKLSESEILSFVIHIKNKFKTLQVNMRPKDIESRIKNVLDADKDLWEGRTYVGEGEGQIFINPSKKNADRLYVSNFILKPQHTITVRNGNKYMVYDVLIKNDHKQHILMLTSKDFNKLENLQSQIETQLSFTLANINGCASYMKDIFYKYSTLVEWEFEKEGTALIGLERLEDGGNKYFCTPNGIYDMEGKVSNDIVYMGNEESNQEELKNLTNLEYDPKKWKEEILPTFLKNITFVQEKTAMMSILGWMFSIPHDYVIRKDAKTGFFPHCHIVGEPGSGKSTLMTELKQFMGHNDSSPRTFPTAFEASKLLNSSYTIPTVLDEYGKRWKPEQVDAMNKVLVEAFTKARWSRGRSDLGSVYYKYKNPLLYGGQIPTSDQALATRIVPVQIYKSFQNSKVGKDAYVHLQSIQKMPDKNFWAGYCLWCANHSNVEVEQKYMEFRKHCRKSIDENRVADIYAVVMLGLHYMKKLAEEHGISDEELGFTHDDIYEIVGKLDQAASSTESKDLSPLHIFLTELATYSLAIGNSQIYGKHFGKGYSVMTAKPSYDGAGEYGRSTKSTACIYGKDMILVKVEDMVNVLNKYHNNKNSLNAKEIMTFIESEFRKSMQDPKSDNNLVLAPKQYKNQWGMYTAFSKAKLTELYSEFNNLE